LRAYGHRLFAEVGVHPLALFVHREEPFKRRVLSRLNNLSEGRSPEYGPRFDPTLGQMCRWRRD